MCFAESGPGGEHIDFATYTRHGRSLRPPGGHRRRAAALRRRADDAPRARAHGPLRLRAADPGRDDQHQRHPPGPRPGAGRRAGRRCATGSKSTSSSTASTTATHRTAARRAAGRDQARGPGRARPSTTSAARSSAPSITRPTCTRSGAVVRFGLERPGVRGVSFQLATYCGRHLPADDLERRVTMPDLVKGARRARPAGCSPRPTSTRCRAPTRTAT